MNQRVRRLILITVAAADCFDCGGYFLFPIRRLSSGGWPGLTFWTAATLLASALPVLLPRGTVVSVAAAPMIAVFVLGGPFAASLGRCWIGDHGLSGSSEVECRGTGRCTTTHRGHRCSVPRRVCRTSFYRASAGDSQVEPLVSFVPTLSGKRACSSALSGRLAVLAVSARTGVTRSEPSGPRTSVALR